MSDEMVEQGEADVLLAGVTSRFSGSFTRAEARSAFEKVHEWATQVRVDQAVLALVLRGQVIASPNRDGEVVFHNAPAGYRKSLVDLGYRLPEEIK